MLKRIRGLLRDMKNFNIVSGKDINAALEKMNNWHFRYDSNTYTTFNKVESALRKNWLWKTKEINKLKKILFKYLFFVVLI